MAHTTMSIVWQRLLGMFTDVVNNLLKHFSSDIPGPVAVPFIGNLKEAIDVFVTDPFSSLLKRKNTYGSMYKFRVFGKSIVYIFDPKLVEDVRKAEGQYPVHFEFKHLVKYRLEKKYPLGLLVSNGEMWRNNRKALAKHLLGHLPNVDFIHIIEKVSKDCVGSVAARGNDLSSLQMTSMIENYVVKVMCRVFFGENFQDFCDDFVEDFARFYEIARSNFKDAKILLILPKCLWPISPAWKRHNEGWDFLLRTTENAMMRFVEQHSKGCGDSKCLLAHLCEHRLMSDAEMFVNVTDLMLASMETSTVTIMWAMYELAKNQHLQDLLVTEYNEHSPDMYSTSQPGLTWIEAVMRESMRLHPAAYFVSRRLTEDATINNYKVEANTHVFVSTYIMGRDKDLFPDPEEFKPERWMDGDGRLELFNKDVPFGFGKRSCIGRRIAESVVQSFILEVCKHLKFGLLNNSPLKPVFRLLVEPDQPLKIAAKRRTRRLSHFGGSLIGDTITKNQNSFVVDEPLSEM